jgi:hypothetical protein
MRERGGRQRDSLTRSPSAERQTARETSDAAHAYTHTHLVPFARHVSARALSLRPKAPGCGQQDGSLPDAPGNNQQNPHHYLVGRPAALVGWANTRGADDPCANSALTPLPSCKQVLLASALPPTDGSLYLSGVFHVGIE